MSRSVILLSALAFLAPQTAFSSDFTMLLSHDHPLVAFQDAGDADRDGLKLMLIEDEDSGKPIDLERTAAAPAEPPEVENATPRDSQDRTPSGEHDRRPSGEHDRGSRRIAELQKPAAELNIAPPTAAADDVPVNQAATLLAQPPRWILASDASIHRAARVHIPFFHQPTYYQELNLERCGQLDCPQYGCLQNAYSSLWFVGNTVILPCRMASQPPGLCVRGGADCPTCHRYACPLEPL